MTEPSTPIRHTVDVIIPTRGRSALLEQALASVERTRNKVADKLQLTVIIIDEESGSTRGPATARNLAVARGSGRYLALLDDDDEWTGERLRQAVSVLERRPEVALVCGDASLSSGDRFFPRTLPSSGEDRDHQQLRADCFVCTSTATLRRTDWEATGGMDEDLIRAEDYELWLRLTAGGRLVHLLPTVLAHHSTRTSRTVSLPTPLSADLPAMAAATLVALDRSASGPTDRSSRDRRGRLQAVVAHGAARTGDFRAARAGALSAVWNAPRARVAWTSVLRAFLRQQGPGLSLGPKRVE